MPDNVSISPGAGATVAADDIDGALYQRMKLTLGADGVNDGDISAGNPLPVEIADTVTVAVASAPTLDVTVVNAAPIEATIANPTLDVDVVTELLDVLITNTTLNVSSEALDLLRRIAGLLRPLQQVTGAGSNRLSVDVNSGTISTVSTVSTVSNVAAVSAVGGVGAFEMMKALSRQAYNSGIRTRIS